jgi:hypothetical protein
VSTGELDALPVFLQSDVEVNSAGKAAESSA